MPKCTLEEARDLWLGGMPMSAIKRDYDWEGQHLQTKITNLLGGKDKFKVARAAGAGGASFGGKGGAGPRKPPEPIDDSKVPHITACPTKKGWKSRTLYPSRADCIISPEGKEYVFAKATERADLIYDGKYGTTRLRLLENSALGRKNKRAARREEKAVLHVAKVRKAKKERRERRAAITKRISLKEETRA